MAGLPLGVFIGGGGCLHSGGLSRGVSIRGGLHSGVSTSGGSASRRWGLHLGGSASGAVGQTPRVCLQRGGADPPEIHGMVINRAVRILLECILVIVLLSPKVLPYFLCRKQNEEETCLIVTFYDDLYSTPFIG